MTATEPDDTTSSSTSPGMTCASCANRIERKLNKLDGVTATVNYATEKAQVTYPDGVSHRRPARAPSSRPATPPRCPRRAGRPGRPSAATRRDPLRDRLLVSALLTVPVVAMAMVPALQFTYWQWALARRWPRPVVVWGAWPFHRAAWTNLRHGAATMDTLISVGTLAAFGWSLYALFLGTAGEPGMTHPFELDHRAQRRRGQHLPRGRGRGDHLHPRRALASRRAPSASAGAALRALLELGAKDVAVLRDGVETRIPVEQLAVGDPFVVRPGEKVATDGVIVEGSLRGRRLDAHRRVRAGRGRAGRRGRRRDRQRRRPPRRPRHPRRRRHPARADGPARRGRAERQGRRCSASPTGSPGSSCRSSSPWPWRRSASGSAPAPARRPPSPPPSRC